MSKLTAAYIAGFIDGEGYLGLKHDRGCGGSQYMSILKITNTKKEIIDWFYQSFGGWTDIKRRKNPKHREAYTWIMAGKKLEPFLRKVYPYLKLKKRQAEILLKRIKLMKGMGDNTIKHQLHSGWNWKYPPEIMEEIKGLYEEIRRLNKRGT